MPTQRRPQQYPTVKLTAALCDRLGIPGNSDETTILAALDARLTALAYGLPEGVVMMDADALEALKAEAAEGEVLIAEQATKRRVELVDQAVAAGKIHARSRDHWLAELDRDLSGAAAALNTFPDGLIPVEQPAANSGSSTTDSDTYKNWDGFPAAAPVVAPPPVRPAPRSFKDLEQW